MSKRNKIIYWIATIWLAMGMLSTGGAQLFKMKTGAGGVDWITELGYPVYILAFLGICKILAAIALLLPKFPILKEWTYSGIFFLMAGAVYSHMATGDFSSKLIPGFLLIALNFISWYFRPGERKVAELNL
jgi:hypothetical protein